MIDLYGKTGHFDVIAITDHILMERDLLARVGRLASLGYRNYSVTKDRFDAYLDEIESEGVRARRLYGMLVVPGAEITQNHIRSKKNSHIVGLNLKKWISADQPAEQILQEIRRQGALSIACHPHHRTTRRVEIGTCYLWDHRKKVGGLVDVWEAANRDDLFSVTSLKHYPLSRTATFTSRSIYAHGRGRTAPAVRRLGAIAKRVRSASMSRSRSIETARGRHDRPPGGHATR